MNKRDKKRGVTLIELTIAISVTLLISFLLYKTGGIGDSAHQTKIKGMVSHINVIRSYINTQINHLGCAPKSIYAMIHYHTYKTSGNTCDSQVFKSSWNGPYIPIKKYKFANSPSGGRILLNESFKNSYGEVVEKTIPPNQKNIYYRIGGINNDKIISDLEKEYNKSCEAAEDCSIFCKKLKEGTNINLYCLV